MGKRVHRTLLNRLFCLLMAFHVINMSVDAPDGYSPLTTQGEGREDLSINDIESISELVLEEGFGLTNAVPEHDEPDDNSSITELEQDYIFTTPFVFSPFPRSIYHFSTSGSPFRLTSIPAPVVDVIAPPPQVVA